MVNKRQTTLSSVNSSRVNGDMCRVPLYYNRNHIGSGCPPALIGYTTGEHMLSTKQVPSCLLLKRAGSNSVQESKQLLLEEGFTLQEYDPSGRVRTLIPDKTISGISRSRISALSEYLERVNRANESAQDEIILSGSGPEVETNSDAEPSTEAPDEGWLPANRSSRFKKNTVKIKYEDPWKIQAATRYQEFRGQKPPKILVWPGDGYRLQDMIPPRLLGPEWDGSQKNLIRFSGIKSMKCKMHLLLNHTHWGSELQKMCIGKGVDDDHAWAQTLRKRISALLEGKPDPLWNERQRVKWYSSPNERRNTKSRSERFIQLLLTVDGIFFQRYIGFPEEVWDWSRYDRFTLGNIANLIGDEFLDGELTDEAYLHVTAYTELKRARKTFKDHANRGSIAGMAVETLPNWLHQFINIWKEVDRTESETQKVFLIGIFSQTRGCGTPPPLVVNQSKRKFLLTISSEPTVPSRTMFSLFRRALEQILEDLPKEAFTGLSTKARVTVTGSACWEKTGRKEEPSTRSMRSCQEGSSVSRPQLGT